MRSYVTSKEASDRAFYLGLMDHAPDVVEAVMNPFGKHAAPEGFVSQFRGTPLHEQAIQLEQQGLQIEQQRDQLWQAREQQRDQFEPQEKLLRQKREALDMQRRMLELELERMVGSGQAAEPAPAPPEGTPPAEAEQLQEVAKAAGIRQAHLVMYKLAAPKVPKLDLLGKGKALATQAMNGGLNEATTQAIKDHLLTNVGGAALLGGAAGYLNADEQRGESGMGGALRGALMGGGVGLLGSAVQGGLHLKGLHDANVAGGMTANRSANRVAKGLLTPEGVAAYKAELAANRTQALKAPRSAKGATPPPAQGAGPIPSLRAPTGPVPTPPPAQGAGPIPSLRAPTGPVPSLQAPAPTPAPQAAVPPVAATSSQAPKVPALGRSAPLGVPLDRDALAQMAANKGVSPEMTKQLLDPSTPIKGPALNASPSPLPGVPPVSSGPAASPAIPPVRPRPNMQALPGMGPASPASLA